MTKEIKIAQFDYALPEERIAKFPLEKRDDSKLLVYREGTISETRFHRLAEVIAPNTLLVCNNTKVIRARLIFFKETGARIELFCLEPHDPADYERAFSAYGRSQWICMVGNQKKWKFDPLTIRFAHCGREVTLSAQSVGKSGNYQIVEFDWNARDLSFGQLLETLGRIPIPPYLNRESCDKDTETYQTVYSKKEGSVAAPTAGLHFTESVFDSLRNNGCEIAELTLHVGAGTFLPVKCENAADHVMHTEHFDFSRDTIRKIYEKTGNITAVGTTSVRTLESIAVLGHRILTQGSPHEELPIGQWEAEEIPEATTGKQLLEAVLNYMTAQNEDRIKAATRIMITPGYRFRVINALITNFHQPQSTLLLLISAITAERWHTIYDYAMQHDFRFLSYGDSSILFLDK